jgi:hypothetical protein
MSTLFIFNKTHIVWDRCKHEQHPFYANSRMEALIRVARKNKYSDEPLLERFIDGRLPIIVDRLKASDPRLELIERKELTNMELLDIGLEIKAIREDHLEKFIAKSDDFIYSLSSPAVEID